MHSKSNRMLVVAALALAGLGASVWMMVPSRGGSRASAAVSEASMPEAPSSTTVELASMDVAELRAQAMVERLRMSGELRPAGSITLRAKTGSVAVAVSARTGQAVNAGDVIVRLDDHDLRSALLQRESEADAARAQLLLAEQAAEKTEQLARRGIASQAMLEKARSDVSHTRASERGMLAQVEIARTALREAEVRAPFDGVLASRSVEPGGSVATGAELVSIVDVSTLEAEMLVSTRDISRVRVGQEVDLSLEGTEKMVVTGRVDRISPVAREGSRFVPIYVLVENPERRLWAGMFATGVIAIREKSDVLVLPPTSLRHDADGPFVLKIENGALVRNPIAISATWNDGASLEVVGVKEGDVIVTAPVQSLAAGMPASVRGG